MKRKLKADAQDDFPFRQSQVLLFFMGCKTTVFYLCVRKTRPIARDNCPFVVIGSRRGLFLQEKIDFCGEETQ